MPLIETPALFWEHIEDLRKTLIKIIYTIAIGLAISLFFYKEILNLVISPALKIQNGLVVLGPIEGFITTLKLSFWVGMVSTSPIWIFYILEFIAPALRKNEQRWAIPFVILSMIFLTIGVFFSYFVTIPLSNQFLSSFNQEIGINLWTLSNYLDYTLILVLANALAMEMCVILFFLVHFGILSAQTLAAKRRHAIVAAFVLGALFTPPDVFTQFMLAIPLIAMYELSILYSKARVLYSKSIRDASH